MCCVRAYVVEGACSCSAIAPPLLAVRTTAGIPGRRSEDPCCPPARHSSCGRARLSSGDLSWLDASHRRVVGGIAAASLEARAARARRSRVFLVWVVARSVLCVEGKPRRIVKGEGTSDSGAGQLADSGRGKSAMGRRFPSAIGADARLCWGSADARATRVPGREGLRAAQLRPACQWAELDQASFLPCRARRGTTSGGHHVGRSPDCTPLPATSWTLDISVGVGSLPALPPRRTHPCSCFSRLSLN